MWNGYCRNLSFIVFWSVLNESFIPLLAHTFNEDDSGRRVELSKWYLTRCTNDNGFPHNIIWSDEATLKLNGLINRQNCSYWALEKICYSGTSLEFTWNHSTVWTISLKIIRLYLFESSYRIKLSTQVKRIYAAPPNSSILSTR